MDKAELKIIYDTHYDILHRQAMAYIKSPDIADEVVQKAFIKLWKNSSDVSNAIHYLKKIVRNFSLEFIRNENNRRKIEEFYQDRIESLNSNRENLSKKINEIKRLMSDMPIETQRVFILSCLEGLKYSEVAEELGLTVNVVKHHVSKSYRHIKKHFKLENIFSITFFLLLSD